MDGNVVIVEACYYMAKRNDDIEESYRSYRFYFGLYDWSSTRYIPVRVKSSIVVTNISEETTAIPERILEYIQ